MAPSVCDYSGYDYKKSFWDSVDRRYEDTVEKATLTRLLRTLSLKDACIMDAGCGFGRLFPAYEPFGARFVLMDYADSMLSQAKELIQSSKPITFLQGNLTQLPVEDASVQVIVSVRTLHHLEQPSLFFKEAYRALSSQGSFIFEIPNKRHVVNIVRYLLKRKGVSPFSEAPLQVNDSFYNFNAALLLNELEKAGFKIEKKVSTSVFRSAVLKAVFPFKVLAKVDRWLQPLITPFNLTPSLFIVARK